MTYSRTDFRYDVLAEQMYIESQIGGLNLAFTSVPLKVLTNGSRGFDADTGMEIRVKEKELMLQSVVIKEIHHRIKNNLQKLLVFVPGSESRFEQTKKPFATV